MPAPPWSRSSGLTREEVGLRVGRSRVAVSNLIRLLDLPDEALELLERGELTEGHGRALLLAADNAVRRSLARQAAAAPLVGSRARGPRPRSRAAARPAAAARRARSRPPCTPTRRPRSSRSPTRSAPRSAARSTSAPTKGAGFRAQLSFESLDDALDVARRLRVRAVS